MRPFTSYGQFQVAEPLSALARLHTQDGSELHEVDHEPKMAVLDQQDLDKQSIDTSVIVPGARKVTALGSCTANGTTVALSNVLAQAEFLKLIGGTSYSDTRAGEIYAIRFYHACSSQTGDPSQEWPPTDCGSSGPYIVQEAKSQGLISGDRIAHGADDLVSLLQTDGVLQGGPFFDSWEDPASDGFVDGDGSADALSAAIQSGVAGGHETYISAIERLVLTATGRVDATKTILRVRNSWSKGWGDHGSFRIHLSTLVMLGQYSDFRQLVPLAAA